MTEEEKAVIPCFPMGNMNSGTDRWATKVLEEKKALLDF
jgi:hypothetical protein